MFNTCEKIKNVLYYSFDIFDTCLVRACGSPQIVFSLMAQKFSNERAFIADFVKRRIQAELEARIQLKKEAVTIDEIYDYVDLNGLNLNKSQVIDMEMSIEERLLYPVYNMLEQVKVFHDTGYSVLYISDMYLPASFLEKILTRWGFWKNGDRLFVSGEYGLTKHSGNLYHYISKTLNIPFGSWHHYGDNSHSDINIPHKLGIKTHKIKNDYSRYENQWIKNVTLSFDPEICQYFAGCARAIRLSNETDVRISLAADVIAPAYIPFVFHVLNDAKEKGITHLFFTARDSYLFYKIALQISHLFPEVKLLSYIHLSRRALWLPSLYDSNKSDYEDFIVNNISRGIPEKILQSLGISAPEIAEYADVSRTFWQTPLTKNTVVVFYNILLHPIIRNMITQRSLRARELLLAYLKQEQLLENSAHSAIVDLGWIGSCRYALNKILLNEGYEPVYTYYWGVGLKRILYSYKNPYDTYLFVDELISIRLQHIGRIAEHYFSVTAQYSTIGYVNDRNIIEPVFDCDDNICADELETAEVNLEIMKQMVEGLMCFPNIINRIKYSFSTCGLLSLKTFFNSPLYNETKLFKKILYRDSIGSNNFIVQSLNLWHILTLILFNYSKKNCWRAGSLVAVSSLYGHLLNNIYQYILNLKFARMKLEKIKNFFYDRQV